MKTCKTCDYFKPWHNSSRPIGECCRYPPKLIPLNGILISQRPEIPSTDGCGEHKESLTDSAGEMGEAAREHEWMTPF